jgi:hypothetical protein
MKRHPALVELSRDHHHTLVVARALCRAGTRPDTTPEVLFARFWRTHGEAHFRLEEDVLLPAYALHGDPRHPAIVEMLIDHMMIRRDAVLIATGRPAEIMHRLGARLISHVRLEERRVFPLIEATLSEDELDAIGVRLAATGAHPDGRRRSGIPPGA